MKRRHRYQLMFNDLSRLHTVWQFRFTPLRAAAILLMLLAVATSLAVAAIMLTPLKTYLPGYMKQEQRVDAISTMMMVDSLQANYNRNQAYLANLMNVFDTDRTVSDSTRLSKPNLDATDTLILAGDKERAFVREMEEKEKYNISITAGLAAEGMIFTLPAPGAIISADTRHKNIATVILPKGRGIDAVSDGTVIDKYHDPHTRTYTVVVQHAKGFMSRYSHLGQPMVDRGNTVTAGQQIAAQAGGAIKNPETIYVEIWRHGLPLIPADYMRTFSYSHREGIWNTDSPHPLQDNPNADKQPLTLKPAGTPVHKEKPEDNEPDKTGQKNRR